MTESTLVLLLKRFDKQQLKDFNNFVKSPFFNTNKALVQLYEYIRKQYPDYSPEKLSKEYVFKKIFGKTEYNDGFLRVLMSNLQNLAEEYLTFRGMQSDPLVKKKYLLDELNTLGEVKLAEKIVNRELKALNHFIPKDPDDYLGMYYIAFYKKYYYSKQFIVKKGQKPDDSLYDEQKYITFHFLLLILSNYFYHLNQQQVINYEPKLAFLDEIITFLGKNPEYLESAILNITYLRVLLLKNNDIKDYYNLKNTFHSIHSKLENKDCFNTVSIIMNYCQKNYTLTEDEFFLKEKFEIQKFAIENDMHAFVKGEGFDGGRFTNIVNTALELDEDEWTENFINEYGGKLESDGREYIMSYTRAITCLEKREYDETMKHMAKLKSPSSATDKFNLKMLQLRLYYEKNYIEQAESAADSFRHLIQNDKLLPETYKESHKNFYSIFIKLISLRSRNTKDGLDELRETIRLIKPLIHKKWLNEKVDELSNEN
jgi:hypothetical protein